MSRYLRAKASTGFLSHATGKVVEMQFMTRKQAAAPPADEKREPNTAPGFSGPAQDSAPLGQYVQAFNGSGDVGETRRGHWRRMALRARLHAYALVAVVVFAFLIALAAANTAAVKVSWLFGGSRVSLVWLVLAAAVLGWVLGLVTNAALHRRTRAPRPVGRS